MSQLLIVDGETGKVALKKNTGVSLLLHIQTIAIKAFNKKKMKGLKEKLSWIVWEGSLCQT